MKRLALFAILLSACSATVYPASQPQYASSSTTQTTQTTQSSDGTTTTTTTTSVDGAQPAAYAGDQPPPPPPPASGPPPSAPPGCAPQDTPEMCVSVQVLLEVGAIINGSDGKSCRDASKALNKYADGHKREIDTFATLDQHLSQPQMQGFQARHQGDAMPVINAAMALDQRCDGDKKLDKALRRVGFTGMIGG